MWLKKYTTVWKPLGRMQTRASLRINCKTGPSTGHGNSLTKSSRKPAMVRQNSHSRNGKDNSELLRSDLVSMEPHYKNDVADVPKASRLRRRISLKDQKEKSDISSVAEVQEAAADVSNSENGIKPALQGLKIEGPLVQMSPLDQVPQQRRYTKRHHSDSNDLRSQRSGIFAFSSLSDDRQNLGGAKRRNTRAQELVSKDEVKAETQKIAAGDEATQGSKGKNAKWVDPLITTSHTTTIGNKRSSNTLSVLKDFLDQAYTDELKVVASTTESSKQANKMGGRASRRRQSSSLPQAPIHVLSTPLSTGGTNTHSQNVAFAADDAAKETNKVVPSSRSQQRKGINESQRASKIVHTSETSGKSEKISERTSRKRSTPERVLGEPSAVISTRTALLVSKAVNRKSKKAGALFDGNAALAGTTTKRLMDNRHHSQAKTRKRQVTQTIAVKETDFQMNPPDSLVTKKSDFEDHESCVKEAIDRVVHNVACAENGASSLFDVHKAAHGGVRNPVTTTSITKEAKRSSGTSGPAKHPPIDMEELLSGPNSALINLEMRDILNLKTFVTELEPAERAFLYELLPAIDTRDESSIMSLFGGNMQLRSTYHHYQRLLSSGAYDPATISRARNKRRRLAGWDDTKERDLEGLYAYRIEPRAAEGAAMEKWRTLDESIMAAVDQAAQDPS